MANRCLLAGLLCLLVACNPVSYANRYMGWEDDNYIEEALEYGLDFPDLTPDSPE